jgi:hypothetical protein
MTITAADDQRAIPPGGGPDGEFAAAAPHDRSSMIGTPTTERVLS